MKSTASPVSECVDQALFSYEIADARDILLFMCSLLAFQHQDAVQYQDTDSMVSWLTEAARFARENAQRNGSAADQYLSHIANCTRSMLTSIEHQFAEQEVTV